MKRPLHLLSAAGLALLWCVNTFSAPAEEESPAVVAQDLKKLRAPGKIAAVLWTRRADAYTLQIVLGDGSGGSRIMRLPANPGGAPPRLQAWLLKADGTIILPTRQWERGAPSFKGCATCTPFDWGYSFPLSSKEAVAVALMINDEYYIETLEHFPEQL